MPKKKNKNVVFIIFVILFGEIIISNLDQAQITPKGIEYLNENSLMEKAKKFLKETKEIMPFI